MREDIDLNALAFRFSKGDYVVHAAIYARELGDVNNYF